jgi:hypothetical protein
MTTTDDPRYVAAWREYRDWARLRWASLLVGPPTAAAIAALMHWLGLGDLPGIVAMIAVMLFFAYAIHRGGSFRCPRCNHLFFRRDPFFTNPLAWRCFGCGLRKWATQDPDRAEN